jgi:hypothetical protein
VVLVPSSSRERRRDPGVSSLPTPIPPTPPRTDAWACVLASYKWCEEVSPRSFDLGVVHDSLLILGQHWNAHAPRVPPGLGLTPRGSKRERSRTSGAAAQRERKAPLARDQPARDG